MKYQIIKEKFDPQGNKIYSKEIFTNKPPKWKIEEWFDKY
jgi:hypothetical protein